MSKLDKGVSWARALDGSEYMPGLVGLNNMKMNDYANVVVQALIRVHPIRCVHVMCRVGGVAGVLRWMGRGGVGGNVCSAAQDPCIGSR